MDNGVFHYNDTASATLILSWENETVF